LSNLNVCFLPHLEGIGGPSSFEAKLKKGLESQGIEVHYDPIRPGLSVLLVVGGTSRVLEISRARHRGVRIVQRLDGINWLHKLAPTGLRHYLRAEWNNWLLATIRSALADHIVYQSSFTQDWWQTHNKTPRASSEVIYNGIDLNEFSPVGEEKPPQKRIRILVIEGSFKGGHDRDLLNAVQFAKGLQAKSMIKVELMVAGKVPEKLARQVTEYAPDLVNWLGLIPHADIPALDRSAHMLFPAEINAACPNSVVEALACGLPVICYATGSLPELVQGDAGRVMPYGTNYWNLEPPNPADLVQGAIEILANQSHFRQAARARAEKYFGLELMTQKYIDALKLR